MAYRNTIDMSTLFDMTFKDDGRYVCQLKPKVVDWLNEHIAGWEFQAYSGFASGVILFDRPEDHLAFRLCWLS